MIKIFSQLRASIERRIEPDSVKGYFEIQKTNPDLINEIKNEIANQQIKIKRSAIENLIFPKSIDIQLSFHQYLFSTLLGTMFNRVILFNIYRKNKTIYPLPLEWLRIVEKKGISVSVFWSSFFYFLFTIVCFFSSLRRLASHLLLNKKRVNTNQKYVYFLNLDQKCFPPLRDKNHYDIMSWYTKKYKLNNPDDTRQIFHSAANVSDTLLEEHNIFFTQDNFPKIDFFNLFFKFFPVVILSLLAIILSFRLRNIILFKEIVDMYAIKFADKNRIAEKYFFNYSNLLYRPLWTYIAESKGSKLIWYFYSCHISNYKVPNQKDFTVTDFFQILNWPKYLVWNEHHAQYVRELIRYPAEIEVVGPIGFLDNSVSVPKITKPSVVLFDIQPFKLTYSIPASCGQWYKYDYQVRVDFFNDIESICSDLGVNVYFKRKRNNPRVHKDYLDFIKEFVKNDNVFEIDTGVSAFRLCKNFDVVLSMPFTAPSVIAAYFGKEAAYYDPSGTIQKDDRAAHNLNVINGKIELREYLHNLFKYNNMESYED